jgi:hypothetical protein
MGYKKKGVFLWLFVFYLFFIILENDCIILDTKVMIDQFILNVMTAYFIIKCDGSKNQRQFIWFSVIIGIFC